MTNTMCTHIMANLSELTNAELRDLLSELGLDTKGKKAELIARLEEANTENTSEETTEEASEEVSEEVSEDETNEETPEAEDEVDPYEGFGIAFNKVFNNRILSDEEKHQAMQELKKFAQATTVEGYKCEETDGWKLWIGPTKAAVLCNEKKDIAFACNRGWWHSFYHGASLCYVETCNEEETVFRMRDYFKKRGRWIDRVPIPGIEIMLPASKMDLINTASGSWNP